MQKQRNQTDKYKRIKLCIEKLLVNAEDVPLVLLGNFNGHLGFLGNQNMNINKSIILELYEKHDLVLLNCDPECKGVITWSRGEMESAIDFIFVNRHMYKHFKSMSIDEEKEEFDISDQMLTTEFFTNPNTTKTYEQCAEEY